jgi:hypothetical protein
MTRFDSLFGTDQPADGLEDELRRMLAVRENDITEAARPALDGEQLPLPAQRTVRFTELPGGRTGTLLAAAVVALLVLGSVFAIRGLRSQQAPPAGLPSTPTLSAPRPTPTPTRITSCPLPASWATALVAGRIAVDQPQNYPISAGPDGTFLMQQSATGQVAGQTDFTHDELAIFDRNGDGITIWTAADPVHDMVDVSPDSATSANWVVYGLTASQNLAAHGVVAWNRVTGQSTTVRLLNTAEQHANTVIDFDPIVVGDTAYWIEQNFQDTTHQTLVSQPLPAGQRSSQQVSHVGRLVAVGSGVGLLHVQDARISTTVVGEPATLTAGPGLDLPASVLAAGTGTWFGSDGTTLRWLDSAHASAIFSWKPGQSAVAKATIRVGSPGNQLVGPFLSSYSNGGEATSVLDTRNGSTVRLPAGLDFSLTTGGDLITVTGTTKFGGTTVHRLPLTALPPASC